MPSHRFMFQVAFVVLEPIFFFLSDSRDKNMTGTTGKKTPSKRPSRTGRLCSVRQCARQTAERRRRVQMQMRARPRRLSSQRQRESLAAYNRGQGCIQR